MPNEKIPIVDVVGNLEQFIKNKQYDQAEEHLTYWLNKSIDEKDVLTELALRNESMMYYRQRGEKEKAFEHAEAAIAIINDPDVDTRRAEPTIFMNAAKVYTDCKEKDKALFLYVKSLELFESMFPEDDPRLANMYNNVALNMAALGEVDAAIELFDKAIGIIGHKKEGELEQALTHLNVAESLMIKYGPDNAKEQITDRVETARKLLDTPGLRMDNYYAMICEKCSLLFEDLGRHQYQREMLDRASRIHIMENRKKQ